MVHEPDRLNAALRLWGRIGFYFFGAAALIVGAIAVIEGNLSLRSVLVVCGILALGFLALGLARIYEWLADKILFRGR